MSFEQYKKEIESMNFQELSDYEINEFIEEMSLSDEITNEQYTELYELVITLYKGNCDFY